MLPHQKTHNSKCKRHFPTAALFILALLCPALVGCDRASADERKASRSAPVGQRIAPPPRIPVYRPSTPAPSIVGASAIVLDANSGVVLHAKNADSQRAVASTQKLMTALLVVERGGLENTMVIAAKDTWVEPSKIYVKAGQRYRRIDLLRPLLVRSGNDVATALARDHSGSVEAFGHAMTARARRLGMHSTVFKNPHGLTVSGQYSTARDMSKLALAAYRSRTIRSITSIKKLPFRFSDGRQVTFSNTNKVLQRSPYCNGLKTGYTRASGRCLVSSGQNGSREIIVIVLGSTTSSIWNDSQKLLHWGLGVGS